MKIRVKIEEMIDGSKRFIPQKKTLLWWSCFQEPLNPENQSSMAIVSFDTLKECVDYIEKNTLVYKRTTVKKITYMKYRLED